MHACARNWDKRKREKRSVGVVPVFENRCGPDSMAAVVAELSSGTERPAAFVQPERLRTAFFRRMHRRPVLRVRTGRRRVRQIGEFFSGGLRVRVRASTHLQTVRKSMPMNLPKRHYQYSRVPLFSGGSPPSARR